VTMLNMTVETTRIIHDTNEILIGRVCIFPLIDYNHHQFLPMSGLTYRIDITTNSAPWVIENLEILFFSKRWNQALRHDLMGVKT
jgi:hypothetical protein